MLGLQLETHCVPLQLSPEPQLAHWPPPVPHALLAVPGWQTFPMQQPLGHVVALQTKRQAPPTHESAPEQPVQVFPLLPQALVVLPPRHTVPEQQPPGQVAALQVEPPLHTPAVQV